MANYKTRRYERIYYKFKGQLTFLESSNNLYGVDLYPRYRIKPLELLEALYWNNDPSYLDKGYFRDRDTNLYLKNITDLTDREIDQKFSRMKMKPPYGYANEQGYAEYARSVFNEIQQAKYEDQYRVLVEEGKLVELVGKSPYVEVEVEHVPELFVAVSRNEFYNPYVTIKGLPDIT